MTPTTPLFGQVAIVTGAGQGIGRAVAEALAAEGVRVGAVARTAEDVEATALTDGSVRAARDELKLGATDFDAEEVAHAISLGNLV